LIPNSVIAKWGGGPIYALLGIKYTLAGIAGTVGIIGLGVLALPSLIRSSSEVRFLSIYCAAYLLFITISGGDWMPGFRFFVPVLPLLWTLCTVGALRLVTAALPALAPRTIAVAVAILALASFMGGRSLSRAQLEYPTGIKQRTWITSPERVSVAKELSRIVSPGSTVAIGECGYIPYFAPGVRFLDLFGLMDPRIARLPGPHFGKLTLDHFLRRDADYYLMMTRTRVDQQIVPTHPDGAMLLASPGFSARYSAVRTFPGFVLFRRLGRE
jgi:arabinofuranosyltransferase